MLTLNIGGDLHPIIKQLLTEFRRTQVSRFPIIAEQHPNDSRVVKFVDSRFPTDTWRKSRVLGYISVDGTDKNGRSLIYLYSRLIRNEKYRVDSDGHYERKTTDPKKMLNYLRNYIKLYSPDELMDRTPSPGYEHEEWVSRPLAEFSGISSKIRGDVLAKEIMYLQSLGVQFQSEEFRQVATKGIELHIEAMRRKSIKSVAMMVMLQPDESVMVGWMDQHGIGKGSRTYDSMEQCPECVQQQVAILKLCEPGKFVPEVGRMNTSTTFWIRVNPDDFNFSNS